MLVAVSISRLLFSRLAITVPAQPFQASIACDLQQIAMAHPTPEDLASLALPPSAQLEFEYPRLNGGQYCPPCPRAFQRLRGLEIFTVLPASTELVVCY